MSKHTFFTTVTPLPPSLTRQMVLDFLHDHHSMIDLNPLVEERHSIKPPPSATPEEYHCSWYSLTDRVAYLPGGLLSGQVTYNACFHDIPTGLQTHVFAPAGLTIKGKWTLGGTLPGEPIQPVELGLGAPMQGLYLREDVDMKCNVLMTGFVKRNLKKSHATLVEKLVAKAAEEQEQEREQEQSRNSRPDAYGSEDSSYAQAQAQQPLRHGQGQNPLNLMPDSDWVEGQIHIERDAPAANSPESVSLPSVRSNFVNESINHALNPLQLGLETHQPTPLAPQASGSASANMSRPLPSTLSVNIPPQRSAWRKSETQGTLRPGPTGHQRSHSSTASCLPISRATGVERERVSWSLLTTSQSPRSASELFMPDRLRTMNIRSREQEEAPPEYTPFSSCLPQSTIPISPMNEQETHYPLIDTDPACQSSTDTTSNISIPSIQTSDRNHSSEWSHRARHIHLSQARHEEIARIELERWREKDRSRERKERKGAAEREESRQMLKGGLYDEYIPSRQGMQSVAGEVHPALRVGRPEDCKSKRGERSRSEERRRTTDERQGISEWLDLGRDEVRDGRHLQRPVYVRHSSTERRSVSSTARVVELE